MADRQAGPGAIDGIAGRAALRERYVKGERKRLLTRAFMIRVIVLMTLMPDAGIREALIALAGDLALVPWARAWVPASARACGDWRNALGPEPLEELRDIVLRASWAEHEDRDWRAVIIGRMRPLKTGALDGTLIRVPDTPANRAASGSVGTGDDSSPFPQLRALPLNDVSTRALLGMPHGPAGTDKAAAGQKLLDTAMRDYPHLFAMDRLRLMDRNFPGAARIARLMARTHVLIRLKASLRGAGPGTGPMLRSGSPDLVRQELAAWAAGTEMTRGVARDAALAAVPARKGRRAGQPVRPREICHARTRRAILAAIRAGRTGYEALTREIGKYRTIADRNRHRARKSKSPSSFGHASAKDTRTRIAPAIITMANQPA